MYVLEAGPSILHWVGSLWGYPVTSGAPVTLQEKYKCKDNHRTVSSSKTTSVLHCMKCIFLITEITLTTTVLSYAGHSLEAKP